MNTEKKDSITIEDLPDFNKNKSVEKKDEVIPNNNETKSGVDLFLESKSYNPEAIPFGNDENGNPIVKSFKELEPSVQHNILNSLTKKPDIELTDVEKSDLSILRERGKTLEEVANEIAETRFNEYVSSDSNKETDYTKMSDKELYSSSLREANPDISDEDIDAKFEILEETGKLRLKIDTIKEIKDEEIRIKKENAKKELSKKLDLIIEDERHNIADKAVNIDTIGGWKIKPEEMNETLDRIMETVEDKHGNKMSRFQNEVMGDAEQMIKAEWYLKYGDLYFQRMEKHYQDKLDKMFQKGKDSVLKGDAIEDKEEFFKKEVYKKDDTIDGKKKIKTAEELID